MKEVRAGLIMLIVRVREGLKQINKVFLLVKSGNFPYNLMSLNGKFHSFYCFKPETGIIPIKFPPIFFFNSSLVSQEWIIHQSKHFSVNWAIIETHSEISIPLKCTLYLLAEMCLAGGFHWPTPPQNQVGSSMVFNWKELEQQLDLYILLSSRYELLWSLLRTKQKGKVCYYWPYSGHNFWLWWFTVGTYNCRRKNLHWFAIVLYIDLMPAWTSTEFVRQCHIIWIQCKPEGGNQRSITVLSTRSRNIFKYFILSFPSKYYD